ncbi:hypothetical protein NBRC116188_15870 [Oceaniserpentilla sp. 4NH20-0058]|uniref:GNAT family N-acetyltransferase n=1 Tax=Oceaniserpentilla sp. 4NH20-0058 TaxID=3127660 RepID=UPI00310432BE
MTLVEQSTDFQFSLWQGENFRPVNQFYRTQKHKGSASGDDKVFIIQQESVIVGAVRLVPYSGYYWLRGLYIKNALQGKRLGSQLLDCVAAQISLPIYCFPYPHLDHFYSQAHYQHVDENLLPDNIATLFERYNRKGQGVLVMATNLAVS